MLRSRAGRVLLHVNSGAGLDTAGATLEDAGDAGLAYRLAVLDTNADGRLDLVLTGGPQTLVLQQQSGGGFTPGSSLPVAERALAGDVNGDGQPELITTALESPTLTRVRRYSLGSGGPALLQEVSFAGAYLGEAIADVDGNATQDLLMSWSLPGAGELRLGQLPSLGAAGFGSSAQVLFDGPAEAGFGDAADVDSDGDLDLLLVGPPDMFFGQAVLQGRQVELYLSDGAGQFAPFGAANDGGLTPTDPPLPFSSGIDGRGLVDLDADGLTDFVHFGYVSFTGPTFAGELHRGLPSGGWELDPSVTYPGTDRVLSADFGDVDGDGNVDAFTVRGVSGNVDTQSQLLLGDGLGALIPAAPLQTGIAWPVTSVTLFDLDLDGDLDAYLGGRQSYTCDLSGDNDWLLRNVGGANFVDATAALSFPDSGSSAVAVSDIDLDGDLDLILNAYCYAYDGVRVLENLGGTFIEATDDYNLSLTTSYGSVSQIRAADLDGDGRDELLVLTNPASFSGAIGLLNAIDVRPGGILTELPLVAEQAALDARDFEVVDVEGDGDLDLVVALKNSAWELWRQDNGAWSREAFPAGLEQVLDFQSLNAADVDGDGDVDLVSTGRTSRNLTRELWVESPASLGKSLALQLRAAAGSSPYVLLYSTSLGSTPLPGLGTLRLGLGGLRVLGTGTIDPEGEARFEATIPANPGLIGLTFYAQAVLDAPLTLTRAVDLTIDGN